MRTAMAIAIAEASMPTTAWQQTKQAHPQSEHGKRMPAKPTMAVHTTTATINEPPTIGI